MLKTLLKRLSALLLLTGVVESARSFSLLGPYESWQSQDIAYQLPFDSGGPMNLGEEYRLVMPVIVYGYDQSFLDYFGADGVAAIEKAIKIMNDLPPASAMSADLSEFPLDTRRYNYQASALGIFDLKSEALSLLLEEMGLAAPERWVYTIRSRVVINNIPLYTIVKRNFDPVTWQPSSYVNGTLYTYTIQFQPIWNIDYYEAVDLVVDPNAPAGTTVISLSDIGGGAVGNRADITIGSSGLYYTGLTRDDMGALRYIYRKQNFNTETLPPGAVAGSGGIWSPPPGTNAVALSQALRPGIDKVTFVRANFDSMLGQFETITNRYTDYFVTNGVTRQQGIERVLTVPDIVFGAADLGVTLNGYPFGSFRTIASGGAFVNNDAINGTTPLAGPGQINPPLQIQFNKIGPFFRNIGGGSEENASIGFTWGHFDGTTNAPVIFPSGSSIQDLERLVLGSGGGSPWNIP